MKVLAIIPGRSGSKGVPGKNVKIIGGKPLIAYSIESALDSNLISQVIVSSDGDEILDVAREYPAVKLHKRKESLASDRSPIVDTIRTILEEEKDEYDIILLLQPTSPLRSSQQIDEAIRQLNETDEANSVISVIPMDDIHPARMYWLELNHKLMNPIMPDLSQMRRQDIPPAYYRNGAIYGVKTKAFKEQGLLMASPSCAYEMSVQTWLNIDDKRDLIIAEALITAWKKGEIQ